MTDRAIRRILIACDAACDISAAVEAAAALAARWHATLHGIFLEDENLYRLAALPFGRQASLSSAAGESLNTAELERLSAALGAAMQRALAAAAVEHGLEWSFGILRDLPSVAALVGIDADLLVLEATTRPFSGSWAPQSSWSGLPRDYGRPILLRRLPRIGAGPLLILLGKGEACESAILSGLTMAGAEGDVVLLLRDGSSSDMELVRKSAESVGREKGRKIRVDRSPEDMRGLLRRIERLKPALLVVDATQAEAGFVRDLLAGTRCNVLFLP
jgi:hypothetical protein